MSMTDSPVTKAQTTLDSLNATLDADNAKLAKDQTSYQNIAFDPHFTALDSNVKAGGTLDAGQTRDYNNWLTTVSQIKGLIIQDKLNIAADQKAISDFSNTPAGKILIGVGATNAQTALTNAETQQIQANAAAAKRTFWVKAGLITVGVAALIVVLWFIHREFAKPKV